MSKLFSTRIRVYIVFMSKSPPFRTRPLRKDYRRRTTGDKLNENLVPEKLSLELEWSIREVNLVPRVDERLWEQMERRYHGA